MKNKLLAGIVLVFGLLFVGCPNPEETTSENWTRITNFTEITGAWEGSSTIPIPPIPVSDTISLPASFVDCTVTMTISSNDFTEIINMDMNKYLTDIAGAAGKLIVWEIIKESFEEAEVQEGAAVEFTDNYHVILTVSGDVSQMEFTDENIEYAPYINQNKTKIKIILPEDINALGNGPMEFILYKKVNL
ncbi:MAG: hypothetical protein LBL28_02365 [Treponema sp.]|jgi:hypothetical protein|nr:hypothetical protein [Treponema sp.]